MARECYFTGKKTSSGNNKSHSNRKTKRVFRANLIKKVILIDGEPKTIKVSSRYYKKHRNEFVN